MRYILDHTVWMNAESKIYLIASIVLFIGILLISWKKIRDLKKQEKSLEEQLSNNDSVNPSDGANLSFMDDYFAGSPKGEKT